MNQSPSELLPTVAALASKLRIGPLAFAGCDDELELLYTCPNDCAVEFARGAADALGIPVRLLNFWTLPWFHPAHRTLTWLNCTHPPVCPCPPGAKVGSFEVATIPHMVVTDGGGKMARSAPRTPPILCYPPPPGAHLL